MYNYFQAKLKRYQFVRRWRKNNGHNSTVAGTIFPLEIATVGSHTYGVINLIHYNHANETYKLNVGNFVSIANNVNFLLCENHQTNTFTTFPLKSIFQGEPFTGDAISKGSIIIEDEVWIGYGVTILSGVTIGKGAIIAAGTIITNDIPPYAVAGGIPGKVIRYRFSEEVRNSLMQLNLIELPPEIIKNNLELFYKKIKELDDLKKIESLFKREINERNN